MKHLENLSIVSITGQTPWENVINCLHSSEVIALKDETRQCLSILATEQYFTQMVETIESLQARVAQLEQQSEKERQGIATALQDIEQRYATLISTAPVGIFRTDVEGNCLYVNDRWCQILGVSHLEAIGTLWIQNVYRDDYECVSQNWEQTKQAGGSFRAEYRFLHPQGHLIWVVGETVEEHGKNGQLLGYVGTITDITERKQAEEALRKSQATKQALLNALPDMLFLHHQDGTFLEFISPGDLKPMLPPREFLGKHPIDVLPPQLGKLSKQAIEQAIQTQQMQTFYYRLPINEQQWCDYEARVVSTDTGEVLSIIRDISDRQQAIEALQQLNSELEARVEQRTLDLRDSEERFRQIFEASPLGIALIGLNYRFVRVNPALTQIIGYTESELQSLTFVDITHPNDLESDIELVKKLFTGEISSYQREKRYLTKKDGFIWINLTTCVIRNSEGKVIYGLALVENITEKKEAETERYQAEEKLKISLQEKELLLKEVHHRVKNNLQVISSIFSLQSQYIDNSTVLAILSDSQNRINSIALIHEKLYHSDNLAKINFADYVQTLVYHLLVSHNIHVNTIDLNLKIANNITLDLDRAIVCGLLLNELVSNSLKHAFGEANINVQASSREINIKFYLTLEGNYRLVVKDNGKGFPDELNLNVISSLGLRLVQALTRQLRGQLEMYNQNGAVFQLIFPQ